ncbi:MAG: adenylate kinase [Candidatus Eremiobacteraeota bacterium]|nr:adenylate kinase [Candidatus Eremiobacteraeota bacterium]
MRLIFLGPPGAGKGTQARILEQRFGARQIATGDILRAHRVNKTQLGEAAQGFMDRGELVPDELIIKMIEGELKGAQGFIMDGFPRTLPQAESFDRLLTENNWDLDGVVLFTADRETLVHRLSGRWTNPRNGRTYNTSSNPPLAAGVDDEDGGPLVQRDDDKPETVTNRLGVFEAQTKPLVEYYRSKGKLIEANGLLPVDQVTLEITNALQRRKGPQAS